MADTKKYNAKNPCFLTADATHVTRHKHDTTWSESDLVAVNGDPTLSSDGYTAIGREWLTFGFFATHNATSFDATVWVYQAATNNPGWAVLYDAFGDQVKFSVGSAARAFGPIQIGGWDRVYVEVDNAVALVETKLRLRLT